MTADLRRALADLAELAPSSLDRPSPAVVGRHRRRTRRAAAAAGAAALLVAGVTAAALLTAPGGSDALVPAAPTEPSEPARDVSRASFLPTPAPGEPRPEALASGAIAGDPNSGCLWLTVPGGERLPLLIEHDTAVADFSASPLVIRDGDKVLAREGDRVELGGGRAPDGYEGAVPGCPVSGVPFIGTLSGPSPAQPTDAASAPSGDAAERTRTVKIYLFSPGDGDCTVVYPVDREVPETEAVATAALRELFSGRVTEQERAAGLAGFSPRTDGLLRGLRIADGTAYVDLRASYKDIIASASTSCGSAAFGAAVASTLRQFPTVTQVRYAFDGDPRDFVEWSQGTCPEEPIPSGDPCDPRPWNK